VPPAKAWKQLTDAIQLGAFMWQKIMKQSVKALMLLSCAAGLIVPRPALAFSIAVKESIDFHGSGLASDSFDSADPLYSTNGLYSPLKRKAGGDILAIVALTNSIPSVGSIHVAGKIRTGASGSFSIGPNGSVGDLPWVDANIQGIQPGWATKDVNLIFPDVVLPSATIWVPTGPLNSPLGGSGGAPDGNVYDHVFLLSGDYSVMDNGTVYVGTNVEVRIKATVGTFNPSKIYVAGTGANAGKLTTYLTGTAAILSTEYQTQSGKAENLVFLGLPSVTSLSYSANGDFTGVIYAPQADFQLAGSGSSVMDIIGLTVAKTVNLYGHYHFHFDENLKRLSSFAVPIFAYQPPDQTVVSGQNVTFIVGAFCTLPLSYQWNFVPLGGGSITPIPNATNQTLSITNVATENQGHYSVVVSNVFTSLSTTNALLTVLSLAPSLTSPITPSPGSIQFDIVGIAGSNYVVLATTNLVDWSPQLTNVSPFTFVETNMGGFPARFFRAIWLP
jgi:hypothetical protein